MAKTVVGRAAAVLFRRPEVVRLLFRFDNGVPCDGVSLYEQGQCGLFLRSFRKKCCLFRKEKQCTHSDAQRLYQESRHGAGNGVYNDR